MVNTIDRTDLIVTLLEAWRVKLGLLEWSIRYDPDARVAKRNQAHSLFRDFEQVGVVALHPNLPVTSIEGTLVHELLHLLLRPYLDPAQRLAASSPKGLRGYASGVLADAEEVVIERIVRAFGLPRFIPYDALLDDWGPFDE